jgi:hypothetical protein
MLKREKRKEPGDYPTFAFRVPGEAKARINALIDEVQKLFNSARDEGDKVFTRNKIIVEALEKGLNLMKKSKVR